MMIWNEQDWNIFLDGHPVFARPKNAMESTGKGEPSIELSLSSLADFADRDTSGDAPTPSGRRQLMVIRDSDIIVAAGTELRLASLSENKAVGASASGSGGKNYKILHTPNVAFEIHQMVLNPNAKFLAVAGKYQVAVIVLPRANSTRLATTLVDCKSIHVGSEYHNPTSPAAIAKIDWHPWGDGGTTLMVMTIDGKMREYDIAVDTEEPQQVLSFVPDKKSKSYMADDDAEREVASFTIGRGKADWGPLTIYSIMRSGDIHAICPYMPKNATIPSTYVHALECFVAAKQEFLLARSVIGSSSNNSLTNVYDYQHKYVTALLKQLPHGTSASSTSRTVLMHPPTQIKNCPVRQGPFLLQPAPLPLEGCDGGNATDIVYLAFGTDEEISESETERLGVVLVAYQEGRVDVFLDVEKVEARWERKHPKNELPMLAVYETVDLGTVAILSNAKADQGDYLELLSANHPVFVQDPLHDETIYVYHAFGVHALQLGPLLRNLANALRDDISNDGNTSLVTAVDNAGGAVVRPILSTFSAEQRSSQPVVAAAIPTDVYLTYSLFILTSAMRARAIPLTLQLEPESVAGAPAPSNTTAPETSGTSVSSEVEEPAAYLTVLQESFEVPELLTRSFTAKDILPQPQLPGTTGELQLTPDTLRYFASTVESFARQCQSVSIALRTADLRAQLQKQELKRQLDKTKKALDLINALRGERQQATQEKVKRVQEGLRALLAKEERILLALMKKASPELSESETKWFQELRRMRAEIKGSSKYDQDSLTVRTATLKREVERLLPSLKDLKEKEQRISKMLGSSGLGASQAFEYGQRSSADGTRIADLQSEVLKLAERADVTLPRPPVLKSQPAADEK